MKHKFLWVGPDNVECLYETDDSTWAARLAEYVRADWEGRKPEYEKFRNAREVIVTALDDSKFAFAASRANARRIGLAPRPVEVGQRFPALSKVAEHLGVTTAAVCRALIVAEGKPAAVRGVSIQYYDDYLSASADDVRD